MVHFTADEEHFLKSRRFMKELRQNETFCDISLIVGSQVLRAHRCVLAGGSSYFNVLFLGQFAEASMDEINLSEVTKDMSALETMVNFLYTGEIDINADNLGTVVKLSSYFMMETVLEFCNKFIVNILSLQTCLKYHLCAVEHGLTDIIAQTTPMIKTRFHDFVIFEEETLTVSPKELLYLHQNNVFQFCTAQDVLKFVVDWVKIGLTEHHISVGTEILESLSCIKSNTSLPLMHSTEESLRAACKEVISTVSKARHAGHEEFIHQVSKLLNQYIGNRDCKSGYSLRDRPTAKMPSTSTETDEENVLITLSQRQSVVNNVNFTDRRNSSTNKRHTRPNTETVIDVIDMCAYVPRLRCWYYLKTVDDPLLNKLLDEDRERTWMFTMRSDQLVFAYMKDPQEYPLDTELNILTLHSLKSSTFEEFAFGHHVIQHLQGTETWNTSEYCVVTGPDSTLYVIAIINCFEEENGGNVEKVFFRCFKFHDRDQSWQVFFQTETCPLAGDEFMDPDDRNNMYYELKISISNVSNEMLITYCDRWKYRSIIFIVNLGMKPPEPVLLWDSVELDPLDVVDARHTRIVQGKKKFIILCDFPKPKHCQSLIKVKFEVQYHSNRLTIVDTVEKGLVKVMQPANGYERCMHGLGIPGRESTWNFYGDKGLMSQLTEMTVNRNHKPVIKSHPPPPITRITAGVVGTVSKDVLKMFKPVSFLGKKR